MKLFSYLKKVNKAIIPILLFVSILAPTTPALAYGFGGIYWNTDTVTYDMTSLPGSWQTQVLYAAGSWNGAGADFEFISNSQSINEIYQEYMPDESAIGLAGGYRIVGTDYWYSTWMKFNTKYTFSTNGASGTYDIQSIAVHEFGHWLKLNDVYFWPWEGKVMYFTINTGTIRRDLHQDDIDGINAIY